MAGVIRLCAAPRGKVDWFTSASTTGAEVKFRHPVFHRPEGTLLCSRNALPEDFTRIIKLIEDGKIDTVPWITHRSGFDELPGIFPSYTRPETGVIKAIVEVDLTNGAGERCQRSTRCVALRD